MAYYREDRRFTDKVHSCVAKEIYSYLGWKICEMDPEELNKLDLEDGIDYVLTDNADRKIYIQERFRESQYARYNDVTLRFRRDHNRDISRQESEFYKIRADYLVYGIINKSKTDALKDTEELSFEKFAVIDLKVLYEHIENGDIVITSRTNRSYINGNRMYVPIKNNVDNSSSFVVFDVQGLNSLFGHENIVVYQKGYF